MDIENKFRTIIYAIYVLGEKITDARLVLLRINTRLRLSINARQQLLVESKNEDVYL